MNLQKRFFISVFLIFLINIFINSAVLANEPNIYSEAAILIDSNSGNVLYEKNSNQLMYPASTTKVLTAIIAIESCTLDEMATASTYAVNSLKSGYTNAAIQVGEQLTIEDLLYAVLLKSANEAATVIAEHIGGTVENFANIMNAKAIELGCTSTHFVNANGIHDDNHYSTASDLAKITRYCMQNETFRRIVAEKQYTLPATEKYPSNDRILRNSNSLVIKGHKYYYPYAIGVKTGFTTPAKNCLISASNKDGLELISVVLHAETTEDGQSARYLDTINLFEYGNNNYKSVQVLNKDEIIETITVAKATENTKNLNIVPKNNISVTLKSHEEANISSSSISINPKITAPIEAGTIVGQISYVVNGQTYSTDLIAKSNVDSITPKNTSESATINFFRFINILLTLAILRFVIEFLRKTIIMRRANKLRRRVKKYLIP